MDVQGRAFVLASELRPHPEDRWFLARNLQSAMVASHGATCALLRARPSPLTSADHCAGDPAGVRGLLSCRGVGWGGADSISVARRRRRRPRRWGQSGRRTRGARHAPCALPWRWLAVRGAHGVRQTMAAGPGPQHVQQSAHGLAVAGPWRVPRGVGGARYCTSRVEVLPRVTPNARGGC